MMPEEAARTWAEHPDWARAACAIEDLAGDADWQRLGCDLSPDGARVSWIYRHRPTGRRWSFVLAPRARWAEEGDTGRTIAGPKAATAAFDPRVVARVAHLLRRERAGRTAGHAGRGTRARTPADTDRELAAQREANDFLLTSGPLAIAVAWATDPPGEGD